MIVSDIQVHINNHLYLTVHYATSIITSVVGQRGSICGGVSSSFASTFSSSRVVGGGLILSSHMHPVSSNDNSTIATFISLVLAGFVDTV